MIDIILGDCLDIMKDIPKGSIDLILTDPPFGTSACTWDTIIPLQPLWKQLIRITKPSAPIVLFASQPFTSILISSNLAMYKYSWVWEKPSGANFLNFKYQPAKVHEDIVVFGRMATSYSKKGNLVYYPQMTTGSPYTNKSGKQRSDYANSSVRSPIKQVITVNKGTRYPRSVLHFPLDKGLHPTQKPVALLEYLINTYSKPDNIVLDFALGSGTTALACKNLNRSCIGIEINPDYYQLAKDRLAQSRKNPRLL